MTGDIDNALMAWSGIAVQPGLRRYALLDSAPVEGAHLTLQKWGVRHASLFDGKREEALREIAPLLIDLDSLRANAWPTLSQWLWDLGSQHPCLSWMLSPLDVTALAWHLRLFHTVDLSDGQAMLLRWYDTRILPEWLACLDPEQDQYFCAPLAAMHCLDRGALARTLFQDRQATEMAPPRPQPGRSLLKLDDRQFGRLMEACQVDMVLNRLQQFIAPELSRLPRAKLSAFVQEQLGMLAGVGIDDVDRQLQCLLPALYTSGEGMRHPAFQALLRDPPAGIKDFSAAIQKLPGEFYEAGVPLWNGQPA